MSVIAVDDERIALQLLITSIQEVLPNVKVNGFSTGEEALSFADCSLCELAFLDIDMGDVDGIELAKHLKKLNPKVNIIFVTAYRQYAVDALTLHSSGYILKPITTEKIECELENLRHPIDLFCKHELWFQCFGNFEVFINGIPMKFTYSKTKELLAYLIDRKGAACTNGEIIATLWEDIDCAGKRNSYLRDLKSDLWNTFSEFGITNVICKKRGTISIIPSKIACDYYNWMNGELHAINSYKGEYMSQYSWGEFTLGGIEMTKNHSK